MPTGCKCQGHSKSTFLLEQSRRLYHTDIVSYGSDLSNNPAGKNSMDQHQNTTLVLLVLCFGAGLCCRVYEPLMMLAL